MDQAFNDTVQDLQHKLSALEQKMNSSNASHCEDSIQMISVPSNILIERETGGLKEIELDSNNSQDSYNMNVLPLQSPDERRKIDQNE